MKKIFLAATKQNSGKTTVALGLIFNLKERFKKIGFIKPIGQRYLEEGGDKVDEDSVLMERFFESLGIRYALKDMSPIAVEKGFTERFILNPDKQRLTSLIKKSFSRIAKDKDLMVIEGTGHAAVGSVFDHSNAYVAKLLGAKVILISSGGIGRPIDEIVLNKSLFEKEKVQLLGVIINKVLPEKFPRVNRMIRRGLERKGIDVLGVIPYLPLLSYPSVEQILDETNFKLLSGREGLNNLVKKIVVGAMEPHNALNYFVDRTLLITPGDREDMILASLGCYFARSAKEVHISGIVLTGNLLPHKTIMNLVKQTKIPILLAEGDTYSVASCIHDLMVKIRPKDKEKIEAVKRIINKHVDLDRIIKKL
ncbi:MAG: AAA family ATPase [Candidatus Omnitrophica bacterium]|nr:AAA family ATPase [Candidatus Omnitrophota bacterium]